ncbi:MAG: ankyrin repeat domain-containing protein [Holosporaceae bacterium]|jgi:hypothetical protein|nr:ankyrin repeat domain-containing protein [Holosporaceae bacterium]
MKKSLYFIGLSILSCAIFDTSAVEHGENLKRITSGFNIYDVSSSAKQKSIYQQIEEFCANNHTKPCFSGQSEAEGNEKQTALHFAAHNNSKDVAKFLIDSGANINARDKDGKTPADLVDKKTYPEIAELFENEQQLISQASGEGP